MNKPLSKTTLWTSFLLLTACGGGGSTSSAPAIVDPFLVATASFDGSGTAPTSSSSEDFNSLLSKLNDPADGANMPFISVNIITGAATETTLEMRPIATSVSTSSPVDSQVDMYIAGNAADGETTRVGEYGAHFLSNGSSENTANGTDHRNGYIGILTDTNNQPTAGAATYTGQSRTIYQNRESAIISTYSGALDSTFVADFSANTISGNTTGDIIKTNDSNSTLPVSISYYAASIESSRFNASGNAVIDNSNIPVHYHGAFFGPQAEEMGFVAANSNTGNITLLDYGYFEKQ